MKKAIGKSIFIEMILLLLTMVIFGGCSDDDSDTDEPTVVATEVWESIVDANPANVGSYTLTKKSDGIIYVTGSWNFIYGGSVVKCVYESGTANVQPDTTLFSYTAKGTATYTAAPPGYQTSPFTLNILGTAQSGTSTGTWNMSFTTYGWPSNEAGTYISTRKSGTGVTN